MERDKLLLCERLAYLALIAWLQWNVLREGQRFAKQLAATVAIPGVRDEGPVLGPNDLSDHQWRSFRESAPLLSAAILGFIAVSRLTRLQPASRQMTMVAVSLSFLVVLHGTCALHVVVLALGGYLLSRRLAGVPYGILGVWIYACGSLLLARLTEGLPYASISPIVAPLDRHRGLLRWHIHYNLLVLRLISYAADLHWARRGGGASGGVIGGGGASGVGAGGDGGSKRLRTPSSTVATGSPAVAAAAVTVTNTTAVAGLIGVNDGGSGGSGGGSGGEGMETLDDQIRARVEAPLPLPSYYGLLPFLEYVFYPPLYIAGPIITFNSFTSQRLIAPLKQLTRRQVVLHCLRGMAAWVCLEFVTHTLPYNAIARYRLLDWLTTQNGGRGGAGSTFGLPIPRPLHYAIAGYWVLLFMWLKFTVIWRFFRAVAMADGIAPPENMTRCVCNNYDIEGFWRSWHASYNRWLVRYMYVPLGGSTWRAVNVWCIFTFVALWHDLEWRLLGWAFIMAAAITPEVAVKALGRSAAARAWYGTVAFRFAAGAAAAVNMLLLMVGNLVGFVVGVDGIRPLLRQVLGQPRFLCVVLLALFAAAQLMFWVRERERKTRRAPAGRSALISSTSSSPMTKAALPVSD